MKKVPLWMLGILLLVSFFILGCVSDSNNVKVHDRFEVAQGDGLSVQLQKATLIGDDYVITMLVSVTGDNFKSKVRREAIGNVVFDYTIELFEPNTKNKQSTIKDGLWGEPKGESLLITASFPKELVNIDKDLYVVLYKLGEGYKLFPDFDSVSTPKYVFALNPYKTVNLVATKSSTRGLLLNQKSLDICNIVKSSIDCQKEVALFTQNIKYCDLISIPAFVLECKAIVTKDKSFCKDVNNMGHDKNVCESRVDTVLDGENGCKGMGGRYQHRCQVVYSISKVKDSCDGVHLKGICEAILSGNLQSCDKYTDYEKDNCYIGYAVYTAMNS